MAGVAGDLRIYGDGSALERIVAADEVLLSENLQFTNFTVNAGVTLTVPSGTVIRCTGTFTNAGTIVVQTFARGGFGFGDDSTEFGAVAPPSPGLSARPAGQGEFGDNTDERSGGVGGIGLLEGEARAILNPGPNGGGGGAASDDSGAAGGGSLVILARGVLTNTGQINADGLSAFNAGSGGGGGGIVVLASVVSVTNSGSITARGGNGENGDANEAPSGGGGGGIVHMLAPIVASTGTTDIAGGIAGAGAGGSTTEPLRRGGAGGGACGGSGGAGGSIDVSNVTEAGTDGAVGYSLISILDPTPLF